jgi:hypothetical protein
MKRYYWNYTSCIQSDNFDAIGLAIICLLSEEGYRYLPNPPQPPDPKILKKCKYPWQTLPNLAIVGLFVGAKGWTIIKTSPMELLCRRVRGANCLGLSALAIELGCEAFHYSAYSGFQGILVEVDASGNTLVSGWAKDRLPQGNFYGEPVRDENLQFYLLNVSEEMQAAVKEEENDEEYDRMLAELEQLFDQDREKSEDDEEINWRLFDLEDEIEAFKHTFQLVDEALEKVMGSAYWHPKDKNIISQAFAEQKQLEKDGSRILFFQTPPNSPPGYWDVISDEAEADKARQLYSQPTQVETENITGAIANEVELNTDFDFGIEEDIPF